MTIESMAADGREPIEQAARGAELGLAVSYGLALLVGPVAAIMLWIAAFGIWGTDNPAQAGAIPSLVCIVAPVVIGIALGARARKGSRAVLVAPAVPFVLAAIIPLEIGDGGRLAWPVIAAVYAFGPVIAGRLVRHVRAARAQADSAHR
jgi:hypothetical protein